MVDEWPAVVVGAGVAGCAAAITLARSGVRTLLLETQPAPVFQIGETLPPAAKPLLRDLGVWEAFLASHHLPSYGSVSVWGSSEPASQDFIFDRNGHGWQLDRAKFNKSLRSQATASGVTLRLAEAVNKVTPRANGGWTLTAEKPINTQWLVDATGRRSAVARLMGARRLALDSLVARYSCFSPTTTGADEDSRTHVEAVADGWWYSALTPSGNRVAAFLTDADLLPEASAEDLLSRTSLIARLLDGYAPGNGSQITAAQSSRLDTLMGEQWLAVGDAALSFDPLSSQGMLTALYTGLRGGEAIAGALAGNRQVVPAFHERLETVWQMYLHNRLSHYQMEQRWRDNPFWQRRQAAA